MDKSRLLVNALRSRAEVFSFTGRANQALVDLNRWRAVAQQKKDRVCEANCWLWHCEIYGRVGRYRELVKCATKALRMFRGLRDKKGESYCLNNLGFVHYWTGDFATAHDFFRRSLAIKERLKSSSELVENLVNIGAIYYHLGMYRKELQSYRRCLRLAAKIGDLKSTAMALNSMASWQLRVGNERKNRQLLLRALEIRERISDLFGQATSLNNLAVTLMNSGDFSGACEYAERALKIQEQLQYFLGEVVTLYNLGLLNFYMGNYDRVHEFMNRSIRIGRSLGIKTNEAYCLNIMAKVKIDQKKLNKAEDFISRAQKSARVCADKVLFLKTSLTYAELALVRGSLQQTGCWLRQGLRAADALGSPAAEGEVVLMIARHLGEQVLTDIHRRVADPRETTAAMDRTVQKYREAIAINKKVGQRHELAKSYYFLGEFLGKMKNSRSKACLRKARMLFEKQRAKSWLARLEQHDRE